MALKRLTYKVSQVYDFGDIQKTRLEIGALETRESCDTRVATPRQKCWSVGVKRIKWAQFRATGDISGTLQWWLMRSCISIIPLEFGAFKSLTLMYFNELQDDTLAQIDFRRAYNIE